MSRVTLKRGNDQIVTLTGLSTTAKPPAYLNAAVVTATLLDGRGTPVPGFVNMPMAYVPASNGDYEWTVEGSQMMLPKNVEYSLEIKAEQLNLNYRVVHMVSVID